MDEILEQTCKYCVFKLKEIKHAINQVVIIMENSESDEKHLLDVILAEDHVADAMIILNAIIND